ncbi:SigE family RNA polymerase sigma factor [Kribbella sandramycini]|uniref:RNA polymerase sigma factor (Sigma-70 family) n=1 Tax=Kribbella sandramycini TaxID=60450 RepID=A0A7Y4NZS5_9ACTN|nr:SigE family RNA polymerase sigma factor [Kribbella sandramycini]MBB6565623.1 RNA polymerase sigma factor (sigma-70 family) [Kribbella sandramycini]NOL41886.1 SigE family RNA polymerase sigma factor [Kribbella sandramycini]
MAEWERAFEELLAGRGGALRSYGLLLTGESAAAADLVQEALLRVFSRLRVGGDVAQLEGYVRRAMLNQFVDGRRRAGLWRAKRHLLVQPVEHHDNDHLLADDVRRALGTLSPKQRACVVLRYYEDLTVPEIADQLGCAQGTVKRHLSDARVKLATQLAVPEETMT